MKRQYQIEVDPETDEIDIRRADGKGLAGAEQGICHQAAQDLLHLQPDEIA